MYKLLYIHNFLYDENISNGSIASRRLVMNVDTFSCL
jgi:hypothetical protein